MSSVRHLKGSADSKGGQFKANPAPDMAETGDGELTLEPPADPGAPPADPSAPIRIVDGCVEVKVEYLLLHALDHPVIQQIAVQEARRKVPGALGPLVDLAVKGRLPIVGGIIRSKVKERIDGLFSDPKVTEAFRERYGADLPAEMPPLRIPLRG